MKKKCFTFIFSLFIISLIAQKSNYVTNQIIVKFKESPLKKLQKISLDNTFNIQKIDVLNVKNNLSKIKLSGNKKEAKTFILFYKNGINVNSIINKYQKTNLFEYVEPNYIGRSHGQKGALFSTFPNDNLFTRQWSLFNDGSFTGLPSTPDADIDMELAWDIEVGDPTIIVAVLDSGTRINHPEFNNRIWVNTNEINDGNDNDANGYVDDFNGWNFESQTNDLSDNQGHGSNVAGIIGLNANNNIGYAGVDWNCKIMACRVLDNDGFGLYAWWAEAIYYAVDNGASVLNMSLGGNDFSQLLKDAVDYAYDNNVSVVVSSGNQDVNGIQYPARYQNSIAVGSTDANDQRSSPFFWSNTSGSNYGVNLDIVAPGGLIYGINNNSDTNYSWFWGGTSQAAPHVTGVISLLLAQDNTLTPDQIRNILHNSTDDQVGLIQEDTPGFDIYYGYGRLNAHTALLNAAAGINDFSNESFNIYPNPIENGLLNITNINSTVTLKIFNIIGKLVYSKNEITADTTINISNLEKGIYLINIQNESLNFSRKIIKR